MALPSRLKHAIKSTLRFMGIDLTRNMRYDRLTGNLLRKYLRVDSNCVDVGAHKGEILDEFIRYSPKGTHIAFEPIPILYKVLRERFAEKALIYPYALSQQAGESSFNLVLDDPAYSGLRKRTYKSADTLTQTIQVTVKTLDEVLEATGKAIDLIKIDVEGGEFGVLMGAERTLRKDHPLLIFECGKGALEFYGTKPEDLHNYLTSLDYQIFTLDNYVANGTALPLQDFTRTFHEGKEYYFVATI